MSKRTAILLGIAALLTPIACIVGYFVLTGSALAETRISVQVGEYRIDFVRRPDLEFIVTYFEAIRPDGQIGGEMLNSYTHGHCPSIAIQHMGSKVYFECSDETLSNDTPYLDSETMTLHLSGADGAQKSITDLYFYREPEN